VDSHFKLLIMKNFKLIFVAAVLAFTLVSCAEKTIDPDSREGRIQNIEKLEQALFQLEERNTINDSAAKAVLLAYDAFATAFPEDSLSPEFLFKAGEVALGLNKPLQALGFFERTAENYTSHDKGAYSLFLQAYIFDNHLDDDNKAEGIYRAFIEQYPNHPMTKDATFSLDNLGKSDEELIREFEERLKEQGV
jgi:tetratricopeptide (TPR) repeat protein